MMKAERKPEGSGEETATVEWSDMAEPALSGKVVALDAGRPHAGGRNG
ncbi:MAG: hypothetical protein GY856_23100 [bacterium]|nr:hypothetical protein [bacterium]